jgi:hypothetical protein
LLTDLAASNKGYEEVRAERERLVVSLHAVYAGSPSTTYAAYRRAQESLKHNEEMTLSDEEMMYSFRNGCAAVVNNSFQRTRFVRR